MTVQSSYPPYMVKGLPGQLADCTVKDTLSGCALEPIPFGLAVCSTNVPDYGYILPGSRATSVFVNGDFVPGNTVTITINGVAQPTLAYDTYGSSAGLWQAIEAQLRALAYVDDVNVREGGIIFSDYTLNVVVVPPAGSGITVFAIAGGGAPTATITQSAANNFYGVSQKSNIAAPYFPSLAGTQPFQGYQQGASMNVLRKGRIYVIAEQDVVKGAAVFIRIVDGAQGQYRGNFRTTAGSSEAVAAPLFVYASTGQAGDIVVVEINP